jgi:hypothetical protein
MTASAFEGPETGLDLPFGDALPAADLPDTAAPAARGRRPDVPARDDADESVLDDPFDGEASAAKGGGKGKPPKDDGTTDDGTTDDGSTSGKGNGKGNKKTKDDGGTTDDGGGADGGGTDGGTTDDGGPADGGTTDDGTADDGTADGGATDGGATDAGPYNTAGTDGLYDFYMTGMGDLGVVSDYNIGLNFSGTWSVARQTEVIEAAEYISTLVTGDVADYYTVDDLRISISIEPIDGTGGILGQAAVTGVRSTEGLPYSGAFRFDSADVQSYEDTGLFDDIALHEMIHLMGFGSRWDEMNLVTAVGDELRFNGENARLAYQAEFGAIADADSLSAYGPAIETDGGTGTAGAHWDEATFGSELMTGYINGANTLSSMSVAALEDMGYDTVFDAADPAAAIPQMDELVFA